MNNNFILEFLSSIAIQCSTSVICEKFIQEAAKFTNPRKFSPSKILGYTVKFVLILYTVVLYCGLDTCQIKLQISTKSTQMSRLLFHAPYNSNNNNRD